MWTNNDLIYINAGMPAGLYKIASKTDASNIVLVAAADSAKNEALAAPGANATGTVASSTGPYLTAAKAQAIHDAGSSPLNLRFRFNRGDTWRETNGFTFTKTFVTIDNYGDRVACRSRIFIKFAVAYGTNSPFFSLSSALTVANATTAPTLSTATHRRDHPGRYLHRSPIAGTTRSAKRHSAARRLRR